MAFDPDVLKTLSPAEAEKYIRENYVFAGAPTWENMGYTEGGDLMRKVLPENWQGGNYVGKGLEGLGGGNYDTVFFDSPSADRNYIAQFDESGKLVGPLQQQMADSWYDREGPLGIPVGAFLPVAAAFGAAYLPELIGAGAAGGGGAGAGISEGVMAGLETGGFGAGASGISEGVLAGLEASSGLSGDVIADLSSSLIDDALIDVSSSLTDNALVDALGQEAITEGVTSSVTDAALGELGINTALSPTQVLANNAYAQAIAQGLSPQIATSAAEVATSLAGSGLSDSAIIQSALETAGATGATGAVTAGGTIAGGGSALTPGLTGAITGTSSGSFLNSLKPLWETYKKASPVIKAIQGLTSSGSGSSGGGSGLGTLGSLGGILGLGMMMSKLNQPSGGSSVITPRVNARRSKVKQMPFGVNPDGSEKYPYMHFGPTTYYAGGGGIEDLVTMARGGRSRAIRGPGDGVSDSIPAKINGHQPAALADGEFVVDARTVAELGNGSTDAGIRKLEAMVKRVHAVRTKAKRGEDGNADSHLPA
jgi:hypothetical protein